MNEQRNCIICLDVPQEKNPLHLLSCGCKAAWFHNSCAETWLSHIPLEDYPPTCPTCKRYVILKIKYSFQYNDGLNQKYLWWTLSLFPAEFFLTSSLYVHLTSSQYYPFYIPLQSILLFTIPFLIRSKKDFNFFLHNYRIKVLLQSFILIFYMIKNKELYFQLLDQPINVMIFFNFIHLISIFILQLNERRTSYYEYMDLYLPYVKGYDFEFVDTLLFNNVTATCRTIGDIIQSGATKSITSSTEANKSSLR